MNNPNNWFVTYKIAKDLKDLGLNMFGLGYFDESQKLCPIDTDFTSFRGISNPLIKAPLYQQVIDWFYSKGIIIYWNMTITTSWEYHIGSAWPPMEKIIPMWIHSHYEYGTPNEARNEGIIKAIEIIKEYNKNNNEKF